MQIVCTHDRLYVYRVHVVIYIWEYRNYTCHSHWQRITDCVRRVPKIKADLSLE